MNDVHLCVEERPSVRSFGVLLKDAPWRESVLGAQQKLMHTTSHHSFLNVLPCQRHPWLPTLTLTSGDVAESPGTWRALLLAISRAPACEAEKLLPLRSGASSSTPFPGSYCCFFPPKWGEGEFVASESNEG